MITLSSADVSSLLTMKDAIELIERVMITVSNGGAMLPLRQAMDVGAPNKLGIMPGAISGAISDTTSGTGAPPACYGTKLISLFPENPAKGYSSHLGLMVLFESEFGTPTAVMNAGLLTAIRTAAASAVATRALSRQNASVLTIIGTGEQAHYHVEALCNVRDITELRIVGRTLASAHKMADTLAESHPNLRIVPSTSAQNACEGSDIICTVTSSHETVLKGEWVPEGCHVNAVGASIPVFREIDEDLIIRAALFVDYRPSALNQARDIIEAIKDGKITSDHIIAEIGETLEGRARARKDAREITLYRSLGVAAQDLACAQHILGLAKEKGIGTDVSVM